MLFGLFGLVFAGEARAECEQDIYYAIYPSHIKYDGECATKAEALQACVELASAHNYGPPAENWCLYATTEEYGPHVFGGWFWEWAYTQKTPLHHITSSYGVSRVRPYRNQGSPDCDDQCFGDPINAGTGNKFESHVEFRGEGTSPLEISWTYNSHQKAAYTLPSTLIFGRKRTHFYGRSVIQLDSPSSSVAFVSRPDGNALRFSKSPQGWVGASGNDEKFRERMENGALLGWELESSLGDLEIYDLNGRLIELRNRNGTLQRLSYYTSGLLKSVEDQNLRQLAFEYNAAKLASKVTFPDGNYALFRYSSAKDLTEVEYMGGGKIQYRYNEAGYVTSSTPGGALTGVIDETEQRYSTTRYDSANRAIGTEMGAAAVGATSATYTEAAVGLYANTTAINLPDGATRTMTFSVTAGKVLPKTSMTSCSGCSAKHVQYSYDTNGRADIIVDSNSTVTDHDYNDRGLETQRIEAKDTTWQRTIQSDWHMDFSLPIERRVYGPTGEMRGKSTWVYNPRGQALAASQIDPVTSITRTTATTYCEQSDIDAGICPLLGLVTEIDGPRIDVNDVTVYAYYASDHPDCGTTPTICAYRKGDLWKVTTALGHVTEYLRYDGAGRVLSMKDPNGVATDFEYHPRGWLTAQKVRGTDDTAETDDRVTRIDYWPTGLVKQVTQPDGSFVSYTYDPAHRLTDIADNAGNTIHYTLDNAGNRLQEDTKDVDGTLKRTLSRVYNQLGQLQTQADAQSNPTDFTYDANGNTDTVTDALSRVTDNDYDPLNRLKRTLQDVAGIAAETQFEYDALDHLTKVTDPKGLETNYVYNGLGDLLELTSPDTGLTTYTYDSAGNRETQTDARGIVTTYTYDALNRLRTVSYSDGSPGTTYTYDLKNPIICGSGENYFRGHLTKISDASGTTQYCYDRFGDLTRKVQTTNGKAFAVRYAYTKSGQLQNLTYPDGTVVDYVRNALGQVTEVGATRSGGSREVLLTQAAYLPFGPVSGWSYGSGRSLIREHDLDYRPVAIHDAATGGLSVGFGFDPVGNLDALSTATNHTVVTNFEYDNLNRLTAFLDGPTQAPIESYAYDATGNRTGFSNNAGSVSYDYPATSHRLAAVGGIARSYDAAGNTTAIGGAAREFVYDGAGRMAQTKQGGAVVMEYRYNGRGEQVRKFLATTNTYTVYDDAGRWLGDYDNAGAPIQQAIWLDDLPVGLLAGPAQQLHYIEPDHLGTPRVVIDPVRNVAVWHWDLKSEAFGNSPPNEDPDGNSIPFALDMRFPGQRYDAASGLNYNYFRDGYDASTGRYTQSDPVGLMAGVSTYGYVSGSPLVWFDMYGLLQWTTNPIVWSPTLAPGLQTHTFPGDGASTVTGSSLARTTLDWSISSACTCAAGGYSLDEYKVNFTPIVFLRQRYDSLDQRRDSRRAELDHVRDFNGWIGGARTAAQDLENSMKGQSFGSAAECENAARQAMQQLLQAGARQTAIDSHNRWDASGRHTQVVPGP